jgi:DNA helicase IV
MTDDALFPELESERARLVFSRVCRDSMVTRLQAVDPDTAADEITKQYIEMTVGDALLDLSMPGAGEFFGRIDEEGGDRWYVGRRQIEDDDHDPVVVDWRAPIAAPFYRATAVDPVGLAHRRRFTLAQGEITAYLDEQLDDPDSGMASGIPDPVLAEIGAARTGAMREIVATIQAEQDEVIRAGIDQCVVVQGGPGTGKTAVGLHRAAYLLFEHRRRLAATGILVVGPNQVFLDYIGNVLPSLGERSVRQVTIAELCVPRIEITGRDTPADARIKGSPAMLAALEAAVNAAIRRPDNDLRVGIGSRSILFTTEEMSGWLTAVLGSGAGSGLPFNQRKEALRNIAQRELQRRTGDKDLWAKAAALKAEVNRLWPAQNPKTVATRVLKDHGLMGAKYQWTLADQLIVDELNSLLNGPPLTYGHVVVDEAQDHSAVALRCIGRRSPTSSLTILGDLAQSTTPAGQSSWTEALAHLRVKASTVSHLTIGYRVPKPILDVANTLLPLTAVDAEASTSVRMDGEAPSMLVVPADEVAATAALEVVRLRHHHVLTGIVAPERLHAALATAVAVHGLTATSRVQQIDRHEVPLFAAEAVKGLEFDGVVVVNPQEILHGDPDQVARGARLLYVALTRAVQALTMVGDAPFEL